MFIPFLISRIQNARITRTDPSATASVAIDLEIMRKANINEFQKVELSDHDSGIKFKTYVTVAEGGTGEIQVNGPMAANIKVGSSVTITAYALLDERELNSRSTAILYLNKDNGLEKVVSGKL